MLVQLNGIIPQPRLEVINSELMRDIGDDLSQFGGQRNLPFTKRLLFAESCLQLVRRIYAGLDTTGEELLQFTCLRRFLFLGRYIIAADHGHPIAQPRTRSLFTFDRQL